MNNRIKELMVELKKTVSTHRGDGVLIGHNEIEKFAELIVQECIDVVDVGGEFVSRPKMVERLKEHFGVEE